MSRPKTIATLATYDDRDCTQSGYDVAIRDDGTARVRYSTRWQGARDGTTWIARCLPDALMRAARGESSDDEPDLRAAWRAYQRDIECEARGETPDTWRLIRCGNEVRS